MPLHLYETSATVFDLMAQRERARQERRWPDADSLRVQARAMGYELDDTPQGQQVRRV